MKTLEIRWTVSRGRYTQGWRICSLWSEGRKLYSCNGGGYDMEGTVLGQFIDSRYQERLLAINVPLQGHTGLAYHDPTFDPGKVKYDERLNIQQAEAEGKSLGLEKYQAFYAASSRVPTTRHSVAMIDGACGSDSVIEIARLIGVRLQRLHCPRGRDWMYSVSESSKTNDGRRNG